MLTCARGGSQFIGGRVLQGSELTAQRLGHGHKGAGQGLANPALVIEGDQHAIDAIHAGAGHQAGVYLVRVGDVCLGSGAGGGVVLHGAGIAMKSARQAGAWCGFRDLLGRQPLA